jgi:hypothetical protein
MLVFLAVLGGATVAMPAIRDAAGGLRFAFSITPASQSAVRGGSASFSIGVVRVRGFSGDTTRRVEGLPPGVSALTLDYSGLATR